MDDLSDEQRAWERDSEVHGPEFAPGPNAATAPRLILFGAVPLSRAVSTAARMVGWRSDVVDPRVRFAHAEEFPDAGQVLALWPEAAFERLGGLDEGTGVVVLTHAPELDDPALLIALRSPAFFIGALGSRRTQANRRERLRAAGLDDGQLARLSGPAGLDLGGETAAEAALSILAEAVAAFHGRAGAPLRSSANAIHIASRP